MFVNEKCNIGEKYTYLNTQDAAVKIQDSYIKAPLHMCFPDF